MNEIVCNAAAASLAGAIQISIFNPLDCLRVRWQVAGQMDASFAQFAISLVRNEGWWRGLHSVGLGFNQVAVGVSQGLRMGMYPTVRDSLIRDGGSVTPAAMATAGLVSGSLGYLVSAPVWLLKTRSQNAGRDE